jgi:hypothetical protein
MLPNFVGTTHVVLPSAGNGTFWDAPGGSGAVAPDVVASPAPARDVSTPWPLNTPDLAVLGPEHFALHDECSNAPENQIGWRRMLRPGAGVFVSSWGRAVSGLALTRLAGSQSLDIDRAFDSQQPVSMYIKQVGNTSSTPVSLVFETWWQYGVIKLSRLLANHPRAQHIPAPVLDEWFPAKFDANPHNTMAHNMVPWPLGSEVPASGVDTRFVARYAQQNRRAWAYCLLVADTLLRADPGGEVGGYQVAALVEAFGLTGTTRELGVFRLNLLSQGGAPTLDAPLPTEFVLNCPALPLVFDTVVSHTSGQSFPARGPGSLPVLSFDYPERARGALGGVFTHYVPRVIAAISAPEAIAARETRPGGVVVHRGSGLRNPAAGGHRVARKAQTPPEPPKPLGEPLIGYFTNPQVRGMVDLIELYLTNRDEVLALYAARPVETAPNP